MHVKRVELSNFKSFGGATDVPLLPGFTVISGPNGSGKSNILDSLLFCLGLASSRGMRAERLPDLVNQNQAKRRSTVETIVTATFDITDVADKLLSREEEEEKEQEAEAVDLSGEDNGSAALEADVVDSETVEEDPALDASGLEIDVRAASENGNGFNHSAAQNGASQNGAEQNSSTQNSALKNGAANTISTDAHSNGNGRNGNGHNGNGHQNFSQQNGNGQLAVANGQNGHAPEAAPDMLEWKVTRRLRVTAQGTYTSNYYINGEPCTLNELHEQLQRFRIYPEGYNVVLQGDVTSIISMNARERREIIDELAGVASFDRKINQAKSKLDVVKEREERFRIVETELTDQLERLDQDRKKAEKYKQLKATLQEKQKWEGVMQWRANKKQADKLTGQIEKGHKEGEALEEKITLLTEKMETTAAELAVLNAKVKALGEEEYLALQATLATQEAELRQLVRQEESLGNTTREMSAQLTTIQANIKKQETELSAVGAQLKTLNDEDLARLIAGRDRAMAELEAKREETNAIAGKSQAWVQQQTDLRHQVETILRELEPQRSEQVRLQERISQLEAQMKDQRETMKALEVEMGAAGRGSTGEGETASATGEPNQAEAQIQALAQSVAQVEADLQTQTQTLNRLLQEQREKQRELDKLEAQEQAIKESQGTQATEALKRSGIKGLCGIVAELGRVDTTYQLALEIAAGGRMGFMVVEDDRVGARAIDLLKQQRAGRATFLPLNKIRVPHFKMMDKWNRPDGFVDYAVNLISCDDKYADVFAFVFGGTAVFETLAEARRNMGKYRIVTLDGEVLESSGAMTGGSLRRRGRLHFGTVSAGESQEAKELRDRLAEISTILVRCEQKV
ncbi:MAG: AAA family ATPase, partial [Cyanobacteria bacterium P01_D01_bin.36]